MYGISLPFAWLKDGGPFAGDGCDTPGARAPLFGRFKALGVGSVELRQVDKHQAPADVLRVARELWDSGLCVTVHGRVRSADTAVTDVFAPLADVLDAMSSGACPPAQQLLTVTIHEVSGEDLLAENVRMLGALADHILAHGLPVQIALENSRYLPRKTPGDSAANVTAVVTAVRARLAGDPRVGDVRRTGTNPVVGVCFDMGHYAWFYGQTHPGEAYRAPDRDFLSLAIHTHIHALSPEGQTHFPFLPTTSLPLGENLKALGWAYPGVLNLELEPNRWVDLMQPVPALEVSLRALDAAVDPCLRLFADIRAHFVERMERACSVLSEREGKGTRMGLVHTTFYVFNTNGTRWMMDPALRLAGEMTTARDRLAACTEGAEYVLITHGHADHFEEASVRAVRRPGLRWIIPDFLADTAHTFGLGDDEIILTRPGDVLTAGALTVRTVEGHHFRPVTGKGVPCVGYLVSSPGTPTLFFPGDVRDFDPALWDDLPRDGSEPGRACGVLLAHVWLGDDLCAGNDYPLADAYAAWAASFGAPRVLLCHLYENGRDARNMWRRDHARLLADRIEALAPGTEVIVPESGEVMNL